jgi:hypothetical protein
MLASNAQRAQLLQHGKRERQRAPADESMHERERSDQLRPLPSGGVVKEIPLLLDQKPVRYWGGSYVVTLNKLVRDALGCKPGDHVAFRKFGRFVFLFVIKPQVVAPITEAEFRQAREALGV